MRLFLNLKLLFLVIFLNIDLYSKDLTKVTIQLSWFDQFQFAGYYMAKEQGFYKDAGLHEQSPLMNVSGLAVADSPPRLWL